MQIPILNGVYTDSDAQFRASYPVNLLPVPMVTGISNSFLRPAEGIVNFTIGQGNCRGGINWNGVCYRVSGTKLISIDADGLVTVHGDVGGTGDVSFAYSFDRLAVASGGNLFYWDGATLTQVTDPDLGTALDVIWVDGYFMTTDGEFLVVTELSDPLSVNPLKYGSSETDPDPVVAIKKLRNEVYAINRYSIEIFDNVGGDLFPFQRINGAQLTKGCVGTHACCVYMDSIAFVGSALNEQPGVYLGAGGETAKISTQEVDKLLITYTEAELADVLVESRKVQSHEFLYVHLPDRTLVYDVGAANALQAPVWFTLTSSSNGFSQYRACHFTWVYDKWICSDPASSAIGFLDEAIGSHWGDDVRWEFSTAIVYNDARGAVFHEIELVGLTGHVTAETSITTSHSTDGLTFTTPAPIDAGAPGEYSKRLCWRRQGKMGNWRIQRFQGTSAAHISFVRLEARLEPLVF